MIILNLKICLLAIFMFVLFLFLFFLSELHVHGFYLPFSSGDFIFFLLISKNSLYIKDSNALLYRLQVLLFSACCGPLGFVYLLQILTWYQVSQLRVKHLLTSLCLPEKSSVYWGLPASPYHKPSSCFRSRFRRDFPRVLLCSALGGGYARSMGDGFLPFCPGVFSLPKEKDILHFSWLYLPTQTSEIHLCFTTLVQLGFFFLFLNF